MSLKLYMDVHVPLAVTEALRRRGVDVLRSQDDGTDRMSDSDLLDRAMELRRVLFSQDDDFLAECAQRQAEERPFFGLIYAHQLRITIGQCVADLELIAKACEPEDMERRIEHLPLR